MRPKRPLRDVRPRSRPRAARPALEPLEGRTLLSTAEAPQVAAAPASARDNRAYVEQLIGTGRLLTPQESAIGRRMVAALDRGVPRDRVVLHLLRSGPSGTVQVQAAFRALLGRDPSPQELRSGVDRIRQFGDDRALAVALLGTRDFYEVRGGGTDPGFLDALYGVVLRRSPTEAERAQGLRALAGPESRASLARRLITSPEAQAIQIRAAHRAAGAEAPDDPSRDLLDLARPGGLSRVTARALADDLAFSRIANPAPPPVVGSSIPAQPPGYPVGEGFNLNSSVQPLAVSDSFIEGQFNGMGAGEDDVLWIAGTTSLFTYDLDTGALTQVYATQDNTRLVGVAAIDETEAYALPDQSTSVIHVQVSGGTGTGTMLAPLPGGDQPSRVAAGPDGTLWVLAESGNLYSYDSASQTWAPVSTGGNTLSEISVGSASNIWALTSDGTVLQYSESSGFQADSFFSDSEVGAVQAASDGSVWAYGKGFLFMKPSYGVWKLAPGDAQPTGLSLVPGVGSFFAAGSMNRAYLLGTTSASDPLPNLQIDLINFGVVDRQAIPFPSYQGDELTAYQDISLSATDDFNNDIRSLYDQLGEPWGTYSGNLDLAKTPPSTFPDPDAWNAVWHELHTEVTEVAAVSARLTSIQMTNTQIQTINDGQLDAVGKIAGLIVNNTPSESIIDVVLTDLFEAVLGAISSTGIGAGYATLAAILAAGATDAISAFQMQNNVGPDDAVPIAFDQLQTQLDGVYESTITAINADLSAITTDRGKLAAVGGKILSNAWPDPDTSDIITPTTAAYDVYFYQVLTASMWQVERSLYGDYIKYPISQIFDRIPTYAYAQYPQGYQDGMPVEEVYLINQLGSTTDWNSPSIQDGPFPSSSLIAGIQGLGQAETNAFWIGQGGWTAIKRLKATFG